MPGRYGIHPLEQKFIGDESKRKEMNIVKDKDFEAFMLQMFPDGKDNYSLLDMKRAFNNGWGNGVYREGTR